MLTIGAQFFLANLISLVGISVVLALINWKLFRWPWRRPRWSRCCRGCSGAEYRGVAALVARARPAGAVLNDNLSGVRVVKAFAQEQREIGRFIPASRALADAGLLAERTRMDDLPDLDLRHRHRLAAGLVYRRAAGAE